MGLSDLRTSREQSGFRLFPATECHIEGGWRPVPVNAYGHALANRRSSNHPDEAPNVLHVIAVECDDQVADPNTSFHRRPFEDFRDQRARNRFKLHCLGVVRVERLKH